MKLDIKFDELERLVREMKAPPAIWISIPVELDPLEQILGDIKTGKEISINEIEALDGRLLTYKGQQVVLYIMNPSKTGRIEDAEDAPRFHLAECAALDRMRREGRFDRYVATNRKDGKFVLEPTDRTTRSAYELEMQLFVCKFCLRSLNWKDYLSSSHARQASLRNNFLLEDFFAEYATFFRSRPRYTDQTAPPPGYTADWSKISEKFRKQKKWTCEQCRVDLSAHRQLLHCHHINGVAHDNRHNNIAVLCIECHANQPGHSHMEVRSEHRVLLMRLRA